MAARDLESEDQVRALRERRHELVALAASGPYQLFERKVNEEIWRSQQVLEARNRSAEELRVAQGEIRAYRNVLRILGKENAAIAGEARELGAVL